MCCLCCVVLLLCFVVLCCVYSNLPYLPFSTSQVRLQQVCTVMHITIWDGQRASSIMHITVWDGQRTSSIMHTTIWYGQQVVQWGKVYFRGQSTMVIKAFSLYVVYYVL